MGKSRGCFSLQCDFAFNSTKYVHIKITLNYGFDEWHRNNLYVDVKIFLNHFSKSNYMFAWGRISIRIYFFLEISCKFVFSNSYSR